MDEEQRAVSLASALGSIPASGHEWDSDPASWVRQQRDVHLARAGAGSDGSVADIPEHQLLEGFGE